MAITPADLDNALQNIRTAIIVRDFASARLALTDAQICVIALPKNYTIAGKSKTVEQDLKDLDEAIDRAERAANGAGKTQIYGVSFGRVC